MLALWPRDHELQPQIAAASVPEAPAPQPVAQPQEASLGFSTIDVVVRRNDTMDRLFRQLELNLADLAMLRDLPDLRGQVDKLKPGEMLRFKHRDGELVGLERKLSDSETLQVTRGENGFSSNVLENPLEIHTRTASATIQNSLFQAANEAGLSDRVAFDLAEIFQYDI